jgi:hypothetical protein
MSKWQHVEILTHQNVDMSICWRVKMSNYMYCLAYSTMHGHSFKWSRAKNISYYTWITQTMQLCKSKSGRSLFATRHLKLFQKCVSFRFLLIWMIFLNDFLQGEILHFEIDLEEKKRIRKLWSQFYIPRHSKLSFGFEKKLSESWSRAGWPDEFVKKSPKM